MMSRFKLLSIIAFLPLWILLLFAIGMIFTWIEVIRQVVMEDYPTGNPDNLTLAEGAIPLLMMMLGTVGSAGMVSFFLVLKTKHPLVWRSKPLITWFAVRVLLHACGLLI